MPYLKLFPHSAYGWAMACLCSLLFQAALYSQTVDDSIVSRHIRLRIPSERQWLGRESITELERCWEFLHGATGGRMPSRVLVVISWESSRSGIDFRRGSVTVGMNHPAASHDLRAFLLHAAARELAALGLSSLSSGGIDRPENRFLEEGMSELLAHEFANTTRRLSAAWAISHYLDRMHPFALPPGLPADWLNGQNLRAAAPGITFLMTCRELYGRDRVMKLIASLSGKSLKESLAAAFRAQAPEIEAEWLKRVRSFQPADISASPGEAPPVLNKIEFSMEPAKAGSVLELRLSAGAGTFGLETSGIFVVDGASGKVFQGVQGRSAGGDFVRFEIPVDADRASGKYPLQIMAADEGGNLRIWEAAYLVQR